MQFLAQIKLVNNLKIQKSADCHYVTYPNQNRKLSKKGKQIKMQTNASKFQSVTVWPFFDADDVIFSGRSSEFRQSFVRSKIFYERRCY